MLESMLRVKTEIVDVESKDVLSQVCQSEASGAQESRDLGYAVAETPDMDVQDLQVEKKTHMNVQELEVERKAHMDVQDFELWAYFVEMGIGCYSFQTLAFACMATEQSVKRMIRQEIEGHFGEELQ
jgi:hypothetical protein